MELAAEKTKARYSIINEPIDNKFFAFDLPTLIENVKQIHTWKGGNLNAIILLKRPEKSVVLTSLLEGTEINSFQSNHGIILQIIEGRIKFFTSNHSVTLDKGQLLTLHDKTKYRLRSLERTVFLLTVMNSSIIQPTN